MGNAWHAEDASPLLCTGCGKPMRIIAFITEVGSVQRILEYLGDPPRWEEDFDPRKGTNPARTPTRTPPARVCVDQRMSG
jgi:hypothetical protein